VVLKAIKMDGATTADKERLERLAAEKRARVQNSVRLGLTMEWTTQEYISCWAELVVKRNRLEPQVEAAFRDMLKTRGIRGVAQLVGLDRSAIAHSLRQVTREDMLPIWREVNRVRANFWGLTIPTPVRSLWLLVREQFLCLEDLRLGYAILRGDVKIPDYWHTCFRDGLLLLTEGLDDKAMPLRLVPVSVDLSLPYWDGTRRVKAVTSWFFTDGLTRADGDGLKRGKVSAEVVASFLLQIRKDVVETIGWAPAADTDDEDAED
jgi:hypothetical protein